MSISLPLLVLHLFIYFKYLESIPFNPICPQTNTNNTSGYIKSLNFPQNYSNGLDCYTKITVPAGYRVQLIFYAFQTELGSDIVTLYDGYGPHKKEIVELSGTDLPRAVYKTAETNTMGVRFSTDLTNSFRGYYAFYQSVLPSQQQPILKDCTGSVTYRDSFGVIVSPEWPKLYPNQEHCTYKIRLASDYTGITIIVNFFDTEVNADIVFVYEGEESSDNLLETLSGDIDSGYTIDINGASATIVFISDLDIQYNGYSFTYIAYNYNAIKHII